MLLSYKEDDIERNRQFPIYKPPPDPKKEDISEALAYMVSSDFDTAMKSMIYLTEHLKNNYEENFTIDHILYLIGNIKNADLIGKDEITSEDVEKSNLKAKISVEILGEILKQPELCDYFISPQSGIFSPQSGYEFLLDYFPSSWAIDFLSIIASHSQTKRDECFTYGFYGELQELIRNDPSTDIIELKLSKAVKSLIKFPFSLELIPEQSEMTKLFYEFLYDKLMEEDADPDPDFLKGAIKLLTHDQYQYPEEYQIHHLFSLVDMPGEKRSMISLIRKFIDAPNDKKIRDFFKLSVKYIQTYLEKFGSGLSCDLTPVFECLFLILQETIFQDSSEMASETLIDLVGLQFNTFMMNNYHFRLVQWLEMDFIELVKNKLTVILTELFALANHAQMLELANETFLPILFENLYIIDSVTIDSYPCIMRGLYNFVAFCGISTDFIKPYNIYIRSNDDLESWISQIQSSEISQERHEQIELVMNLIMKRNAEYEELVQRT